MTANNREHTADGNIRKVGRRIAINSASGRSALQEVHIDIAELTAAKDPDLVDRTSADYLAGAAAMANAVLNGLHEQVIPPEALLSEEYLPISPNAHESGGGSQS